VVAALLDLIDEPGILTQRPTYEELLRMASRCLAATQVLQDLCQRRQPPPLPLRSAPTPSGMTRAL
jgi:hypothetical protein